ncbi:hypothetical protein Ancab_016763, partial [Ancistrocladus abbreviatus]
KILLIDRSTSSALFRSSRKNLAEIRLHHITILKQKPPPSQPKKHQEGSGAPHCQPKPDTLKTNTVRSTHPEHKAQPQGNKKKQQEEPKSGNTVRQTGQPQTQSASVPCKLTSPLLREAK